MGFMMAVLGGTAIALGLWLVRRSRLEREVPSRRRGGAQADRALAERFARGEIDEAQFTRARTILLAGDNSQHQPPAAVAVGEPRLLP